LSLKRRDITSTKLRGWTSREIPGTQTYIQHSGFMPAEMVTHAYLLNKDKKNVRTFASYEVNDELFSDRNVFPRGCIVKMEKINEK
jgi:hypothetical protein